MRVCTESLQATLTHVPSCTSLNFLVFADIQIRLRFKLPAGDMPPVDVIRQRLAAFPDFSAFSVNPDADIHQLDKVRGPKE